MLFYEESHNRLRKLIQSFEGIKNIERDETKPDSRIMDFEFIQHPYVKKYANLRSFSKHIYELVNSMIARTQEEEVDESGVQESIQKNFLDLWGLLYHRFTYKIR